VKNHLISIPNSIINHQALIEIQQINEKTLEYGLKLSEKDIKVIIKARDEALCSSGRAEFGGGIITKIIESFYNSPYILQSNYIEIIDELIETFYYYKNETMEEISDDELIDFMKEYFDDKCQGDMDLLRNKYLYKLARNIKYGVIDYLNVEGDIEEDSDEYGDEGE